MSSTGNLETELLRAIRVLTLEFVVAGLLVAQSAGAGGQSAPASTAVETPNASQATTLQSLPDADALSTAVGTSSAVRLLEGFQSSDVKFALPDLIDVLRDKRHEGWVLAAYPDPKTSRPLIGAGFTLDLPARAHPQLDPLNPHPFIEPSSADLWQAAGLEPDRLDQILGQYHARFAAWSRKGFRRRIASLSPQITDAEATSLLRVAAIQAIYNAKAYCRNFDTLTASQQMALTQLVYQMGVNLAEFNEFLSLINEGSSTMEVPGAETLLSDAQAGDREYWNSVQHSLMQSQWARLYRTRAIAVIAMLDPDYADSPVGAERKVGAVLRPAVVHRRKGHAAALRSVASRSGDARSRPKRKLGMHTKKRA